MSIIHAAMAANRGATATNRSEGETLDSSTTEDSSKVASGSIFQNIFGHFGGHKSTIAHSDSMQSAESGAEDDGHEVSAGDAGRNAHRVNFSASLQHMVQLVTGRRAEKSNVDETHTNNNN